jgi:serine/threonine-protein kinase
MMRPVAGRYRLDRPVGAGGISTVWRAYDEVLHRTVAVKLLNPRMSEDPRWRASVRAEALAAARLNHRHIAGVYDYGETRQGRRRRVPFLVMEYVEGETLSARLSRAGAFPLRHAVRICGQLADALTTAHSAGMVHRDVKPGNVMLSADGAAKMVDFGLATAREPHPADAPGVVLGTHRPTWRRSRCTAARSHRPATCSSSAWCWSSA